MSAFNQEQYRPALHAALREFSALIFEAPDFQSASFRFSEPIGPGENQELKIRPVVVAERPLWQNTRAGLAENLGCGASKKLLWELANSSRILLEAHAATTDGAALHLRTTRKGHVLIDRVRERYEQAAAAQGGDFAYSGINMTVQKIG